MYYDFCHGMGICMAQRIPVSEILKHYPPRRLAGRVIPLFDHTIPENRHMIVTPAISDHPIEGENTIAMTTEEIY